MSALDLRGLRELPARDDLRAQLVCAGVAILAGVLWVLATAPFDVWPLGWIMLAPALWLIDRAPTPRRAARWGWLTGTVASLGGFHWISDLLIHQGGLPTPLGWLGVLLFSAYQGLGLYFAARMIRALRARRWPMALAAPLALVTVEMLMPLVFPYSPAITQAPALPVIQIAELTGPAGVTALLAVAGGALLDLLDRRRLPALIGAGVIALAIGGGVARIAQIDARRDAAPRLKVGLISEGVPSSATGGRSRDERRRLITELLTASARAEAAGAQLIVWTESGFPFDLPRAVSTDLGERSPYRLRRGFTSPLIFGVLTSDDASGHHWNSAVLVSPDDRFLARHDKVHRVIGSEYNPLIEAFPWLEKVMPAGVGNFEAGDAPVMLPVPVGDRTVLVAPMICFEDILPGYGREVAPHHPSLLVNVSNDSWFGPVEPWQHLALAVFRSVELRAEMVRAVNVGPSTHVDAVGRVRATGEAIHRGPAELVVDAALMEGGGTLYARVGNVFGWACTAVTLALWLGPWLRRRRSAKAPRPPTTRKAGRSREKHRKRSKH